MSEACVCVSVMSLVHYSQSRNLIPLTPNIQINQTN